MDYHGFAAPPIRNKVENGSDCRPFQFVDGIIKRWW